MDCEPFIKLFLSVFLGSLIGYERETKRKVAGLRTYSLVCLGSCLFSLVAFSLGKLKILDPSPIIMAIAVGMGFIGAGTIFKVENKIFGLTTSAALWVVSALGLTIAAGFYSLALFSTLLILTILVFFKSLEENFLAKKR